ncbi:hypothetical protein BDQ17DRAFT_1460038 [Cyathus striatus]|nr:hypothetical protein BDQ17DRAFT_1460038 [Cyathus striatus]
MSLLIRKIKAIHSFRRKPTRPLQDKDWLQIAITAVKLVKSTGDFAPFPFVNNAANPKNAKNLLKSQNGHGIHHKYAIGVYITSHAIEQTKGLIARYRQILSSELQISLLETTLQILATVKKPHGQSVVEMQVPELANYKQIKIGDIRRLSKISREQEKPGEYYSEKISQPDFEEYIVEVAGFEGRRRVARYYNNNALDRSSSDSVVCQYIYAGILVFHEGLKSLWEFYRYMEPLEMIGSMFEMAIDYRKSWSFFSSRIKDISYEHYAHHVIEQWSDNFGFETKASDDGRICFSVIHSPIPEDSDKEKVFSTCDVREIPSPRSDAPFMDIIRRGTAGFNRKMIKSSVCAFHDVMWSLSHNYPWGPSADQPILGGIYHHEHPWSPTLLYTPYPSEKYVKYIVKTTQWLFLPSEHVIGRKEVGNKTRFTISRSGKLSELTFCATAGINPKARSSLLLGMCKYASDYATYTMLNETSITVKIKLNPTTVANQDNEYYLFLTGVTDKEGRLAKEGLCGPVVDVNHRTKLWLGAKIRAMADFYVKCGFGSRGEGIATLAHLPEIEYRRPSLRRRGSDSEKDLKLHRADQLWINQDDCGLLNKLMYGPDEKEKKSSDLNRNREDNGKMNSHTDTCSVWRRTGR